MAAQFALIIATLLHDGSDPVVLSGPEVPYDEQRALFKSEFMGQREHELYQRVDLVSTRRGSIKHKIFISPKEAARRKNLLAKQRKAAKQHGFQNPDDEADKAAADAEAARAKE